MPRSKTIGRNDGAKTMWPKIPSPKDNNFSKGEPSSDSERDDVPLETSTPKACWGKKDEPTKKGLAG